MHILTVFILKSIKKKTLIKNKAETNKHPHPPTPQKKQQQQKIKNKQNKYTKNYFADTCNCFTQYRYL